ncbi:MAG: FAD-binding protein [Promethearchaeota archaeon]
MSKIKEEKDAVKDIKDALINGRININIKKKIIEHLLNNYDFESFIEEMETKHKFIPIKHLEELRKANEVKEAIKTNKGSIMFIDNPIISGSMLDSSHLKLKPYIVFFPHKLSELKSIILTARKYKLPITFSGGKTGLSGGYTNFGVLIDMMNLRTLDILKEYGDRIELKNNFDYVGEYISRLGYEGKDNIDEGRGLSNSVPKDKEKYLPYFVDVENEEVITDQSVIVGDLIKGVPYYSQGEYIFPVQPSSTYDLPVTVGGLISSNASGVTSGKLGAAELWIKELKYIAPDGEVRTTKPGAEDYYKIVGGNGFYGAVLSAVFKLHRPPKNLKYRILFGSDIRKAFYGIQYAQDACKDLGYPLNSEFVMSNSVLPGKFKELAMHIGDKKASENAAISWAILLSDEGKLIDVFSQEMKNKVEIHSLDLSRDEYSAYLTERTSMATLAVSEGTDETIITFPGFEDVLSQPKYLPDIIDEINRILEMKGYKPIQIGYGHLNFRQGKGTLIHIRLPVPISMFYDESGESIKNIAETITEVIYKLKENYNILPKAEHSLGPYRIWLYPDIRQQIKEDIVKERAFINPHIIVYDFFRGLMETEKTQEVKQNGAGTENKENEKDLEKRLFSLAFQFYASPG